MNIVVYDKLPEEAIKIREKVFIKEQGFQDEFDEIDDISKHLVLYDGANAVGTCRVFFHKEDQCYYVGRVAVIKEYRGKKLGELILKEAEKCIRGLGGIEVKLSGQVRVSEFYEKLGYVKSGKIYLDEGCPHVLFSKKL